MAKEKTQVTVEPRSLAGFIASVIRKFKFNNKNQEPDEIIIPDEVSDYIPVKIVWPKNVDDEKIIYGLEKKVKELEGKLTDSEITIQQCGEENIDLKRAVDELTGELDTAKKSIAELTSE